MISVFIEAALRSLLAGLAVAVGLRIFQVRNVLAQKAAWGLVASAFVMPLLLPITEQWHLLPAGADVILPAHPATLLEELQSRILAKSGSGSKVARLTAPQNDAPKAQESPTPEPAAGPQAVETPPGTVHKHRAVKPEQTGSFIPRSSASSYSQPIAPNAMQGAHFLEPTGRIVGSPIGLAVTLYCLIAALLLFRLALGLFATIRLWRTATPIPAHQLPCGAASLQLRASNKLASPITIGSAILLPADHKSWDKEKLRIVVAHERSHIRQGDFYLQLLASIYSALVWFSPLGWWLKHELAELAEAISDHAGIEEAASRTSYA